MVYISNMDSQQTLLYFSKPFEPDLTSEKNVESPLAQGAKKYCDLNLKNQKQIYEDIIQKNIGYNYNQLKKYILQKYNIIINTGTIWNWFNKGCKPTNMINNLGTYHKVNPPLRDKQILKKALESKRRNRLLYEQKYFNLTPIAEQILLGSILGDGYLGINKRATNAYYCENHSLNQEKYLLWKNNILKFKVTYRMNWVNTRNKYQSSIRIRSKHFSYLTNLHKFFYVGKKKQVTIDILNRLKPLGIAVWYMDDGCYIYRDNLIILCTDCYSLKEHQIIVQWFKDKYNIRWDIIKNIKNYNSSHDYYYRLKTRDTQFIELIKPYIHPTLNYKIGLDKTKQMINTCKNSKNRKIVTYLQSLDTN